MFGLEDVILGDLKSSFSAQCMSEVSLLLLSREEILKWVMSEETILAVQKSANE